MFFGCLPCCGGGCPSYQDIFALAPHTLECTIGVQFSETGNPVRSYSATVTQQAEAAGTETTPFVKLPALNTSFDPYTYRLILNHSSAGVAPLLPSVGIADTLESALVLTLEVSYAARFRPTGSGPRVATLRLFVIPCGSVYQGNPRALLHGASVSVTPVGVCLDCNRVDFFNTSYQLTSVYSSAYGGQTVTADGAIGNSFSQPTYSYPHVTIAVGNDFALPIGEATWPSPLASISTEVVVPTGGCQETISLTLNGISSSVGNWYPPPESPQSEVVFSAVQSSL